MSIVGGSLVGTLTTRLPPIQGGSVAGAPYPAYAYPGPIEPGGALTGSLAYPQPQYPQPPLEPAAYGYLPGRAPEIPGVHANGGHGHSDGGSLLAAPNALSQSCQVQGMRTGPALCLTAGLPTPDAINTQKENYARSLEEELKQGVVLLGTAHKEKMDWLHAHANQQKHQHNIMLDQQVKQQEMRLSQHYNEQLMRLQQAAQQQRAELEQQAASLTLEWHQKQTQEEYVREQLGIQARYARVQQELAVEMEKVSGGSALYPPGPTPMGGSMLFPPASGHGSVVVPAAGGGSMLFPPKAKGAAQLFPLAPAPSGGSMLQPPGGSAHYPPPPFARVSSPPPPRKYLPPPVPCATGAPPLPCPGGSGSYAPGAAIAPLAISRTSRSSCPASYVPPSSARAAFLGSYSAPKRISFVPPQP